MIKLDGFDDCIIGTCEMFGLEDRIAYDGEKMLDKIVLELGMTKDEALEHFEFNISGGYFGTKSPCFIWNQSDNPQS